MKQIKLVGREMSVLRAIEHHGSTSLELAERTNIEASELLSTLNGLAENGYVEAYLGERHFSETDPLTDAQFPQARFEINPSYYQEIKRLLQR